jgi:hypothetical protein
MKYRSGNALSLEGVEGGVVVGQVLHSEVVALQWAGGRQASRQAAVILAALEWSLKACTGQLAAGWMPQVRAVMAITACQPRGSCS